MRLCIDLLGHPVRIVASKSSLIFVGIDATVRLRWCPLDTTNGWNGSLCRDLTIQHLFCASLGLQKAVWPQAALWHPCSDRLSA
jgi:hypothetical protein